MPVSCIAHSFSYGTLWDAAYFPAASEVHLLVGRNGAAEWCPTTLYILDFADNAWRCKKSKNTERERLVVMGRQTTAMGCQTTPHVGGRVTGHAAVLPVG